MPETHMAYQEDPDSATCNLGFTVGIARQHMTPAQRECAEDSLALLSKAAGVDWAVIGMALSHDGESIVTTVKRIRDRAYQRVVGAPPVQRVASLHSAEKYDHGEVGDDTGE